MRLLDQDLNQPETARRLKVTWQSSVLGSGNAAGMVRPGCAAPGSGSKPLLEAAQWERLASLFLEGTKAQGFPTPLWSCPRVACLIKEEFGIDYHEDHVWKILQRLGWCPQRSAAEHCFACTAKRA